MRDSALTAGQRFESGGKWGHRRILRERPSNPFGAPNDHTDSAGFQTWAVGSCSLLEVLLGKGRERLVKSEQDFLGDVHLRAAVHVSPTFHLKSKRFAFPVNAGADPGFRIPDFQNLGFWGYLALRP